MNPQLKPYTVRKNKTKINHGPNVKPKTIEVSEKNQGENTCYLGLGKGLLGTTRKSKSIEERKDKLYSIKM